MNRWNNVDHALEKLVFEDLYVTTRLGKRIYLHEEMLAYLLWEEVIYISRSNIDQLELFVHVSDTRQPKISIKSLPVLCELYMKKSHAGVIDWANKNEF